MGAAHTTVVQRSNGSFQEGTVDRARYGRADAIKTLFE